MNDELKACPFCDIDQLRSLRDSFGNISLVNCAEHTIPMSPERWQSRPIEDELRKQLDELKQQNAIIVDVITAMYDQVHEERDYLRKQLEVAVEALDKCKNNLDPEFIYIVDDALAEIAKIGGTRC